MKNITRFAVSFLLIFAFLLANLSPVLACGPFTLSPLFSLEKHPDFPLLEFTNGKTGIVPDTFGFMSLVVFYRQLSNANLTKNEQTQTVAAMENEIYYRSGRNDSSGEVPNYFADWAAARTKVTNEKRDIETEKQLAESYSYFTNCLPDAFGNAAKTLEARISKYGTGDNVKEWVKGQDAVFANCETASALPTDLTANAPEWLQKDRDYQIAAALFYQGKMTEAREGFEKIGADNNSVWKNTAKLVAARTFIRQASFIEIPDDAAAKIKAENDKKELLGKASDALEKITKDSTMRDFHESAKRLLGLVKFRMMPTERRAELANNLIGFEENQNFYNDLIDYELLLSRIASCAEEVGTEIDRIEAEKAKKEYDYNYKLKLRDIPQTERLDDLTDWIFTFKASDSLQHAFDVWKETGRLQWFVAAITKVDSKSPQLAQILSEADKIAKTSPAFATVRYHQIRLLLETNKRAEAKQKLDEIFGDVKNLPLSTQNKFFAQRMILSDNLNDFLKFAQRKPVLFSWDDNDREEPSDISKDERLKGWESRTMFDVDAVTFLNENVPLSTLKEAAMNPQLPEHLKKFLVIAVWTRAYILGNAAIEKEFTPQMLRYAKEFTPLFSKYAGATTPTNREAAALIFVLRNPIIQPYVPAGYGREDSIATELDSIRGNWYCVENQADTIGLVYPKFLTEAQNAAAGREKRQMIALGESATMLTRRAVDFANKNPNHPNVPEILHLAVRSTRYGCKDEDTGRFSKQAFDILHKKYKTSPWTKQTPYWFGQ